MGGVHGGRMETKYFSTLLSLTTKVHLEDDYIRLNFPKKKGIRHCKENNHFENNVKIHDIL